MWFLLWLLIDPLGGLGWYLQGEPAVGFWCGDLFLMLIGWVEHLILVDSFLDAVVNVASYERLMFCWCGWCVE